MMYYDNKRFNEVNVEITNLCDFDCWFCPRRAMSREKGMMELDAFKDMLSYLKTGYFIKEMAIAGIGEPTMHPELVSMIRLVKSSSPYKVVLTTNAGRFREKDFVRDLLGAKPDKVTVSLRVPAGNGRSASGGGPREDHMASILGFVEEKIAGGYDTEIEVAFLKETFYSKYVLDMDASDFIDRVKLNAFLKELSGIAGMKIPSYDAFTGSLASYLNNVERIPLKGGLSLRFDSLSSWTSAAEKSGEGKCRMASYGSCLGLLTHFAIFWNGDVSVCCADFDAGNALGNIFEAKDIMKILSSEKAVRFAESLRRRRMPTPTCRICRGGRNQKEKWANIIGTLISVR